jgi:hypothetical protein
MKSLIFPVLKVITLCITTISFVSCVTQKPTYSGKSDVPGGQGAVSIAPGWYYKETFGSQATPYVLGAAGAAAGYFLTPPPPATPVQSNPNASGQEEELDPRIVNGLLGAAGGYLLPVLIKSLVLKSKRKEYVPTEQEASKWLSAYNRENGHSEANAYTLLKNDPSTRSIIMIPASLRPKPGKEDDLLPQSNPIRFIGLSKPISYFSNRIFPSFVIAFRTGNLRELSSSVVILVDSGQPGLTFKYEVECNDSRFFGKVTGQYTTTKKGKETIYPNIPWSSAVLLKQTSSIPITITIKISDSNGNTKQESENFDLRSINDCPFYMRTYDGKDVDLRFLFAAYVNEEHPKIPEMLKEMLDKGYLETVGKASGDHKRNQLAAIWQLLRDKGIKYSSITTTTDTGTGGRLATQYVRRFGEAINTRQANCIDGTVVFASFLRKIGYNPVIVAVQGHAFLGFYSKEDKSDMEYLETTLIGSPSVSFFEAQYEGRIQMDKYLGQATTILIDIKEARASIRPLGE